MKDSNINSMDKETDDHGNKHISPCDGDDMSDPENGPDNAIYFLEYPDVQMSQSSSLISVQCSLPNDFESENEDLCYDSDTQHDYTLQCEDDMNDRIASEKMEIEQEPVEEEDVVDLSIDPFQVVKPDENNKFFASPKDEWIQPEPADSRPPLPPPPTSVPMRPPPRPPLSNAKNRDKSISSVKDIKKIIGPLPNERDPTFGFKHHFDKTRLIPNPAKGIKNFFNPNKKVERHRLREKHELEAIINKGDKKPKDSGVIRTSEHLQEFEEFTKRITATLSDSISRVSALALSRTEQDTQEDQQEETGWAESFEKEVKGKDTQGQPNIEASEGWANFSANPIDCIQENFFNEIQEQVEGAKNEDWSKDLTEPGEYLRPALEFQQDDWAANFEKFEETKEETPKETIDAVAEETTTITTSTPFQVDWSANF